MINGGLTSLSIFISKLFHPKDETSEIEYAGIVGYDLRSNYLFRMHTARILANFQKRSNTLLKLKYYPFCVC